MQTISVYDDDNDTNLQNLANVLTAHAVPKYFDSVVYDAEATDDDEGIRCYQDGAVVLRINITAESGTGRRRFYTKSQNEGWQTMKDGSSSRFSIVDVFDNCVAIHGTGSTGTGSGDARKYTVFLTVDDAGQTGILVSVGSASSYNTLSDFSTSSSSTRYIREMIIGGNDALKGDIFCVNNSNTANVSLCHFMNYDGSFPKDIYWACIRFYSDAVAPHRVTVNGEQYWAMLYNSVLIKSS